MLTTSFQFVCGNCEHDTFRTPDPDRSICDKCGKVHEKISDYEIKEGRL